MQLQGVIGIFGLLFIAWVCGENRRAVSVRGTLVGVVLQFVIAVVFFKVPVFRELFLMLNTIVTALETATREGTTFVFGYLGGGPLPFPRGGEGETFVLALQALPIVLVMSALSSLLFYWRVLPLVVKMFSLLMERTLRIGGGLGLAVSANIFVGMVEAPLLIRPYLESLSRSELFSLMTSGMATIAGTVMILYASILEGIVPDVLGHILIASLISAPAAITVSRLMVPERNGLTRGHVRIERGATSSMDAITKGTFEGLKLLLNIVAMLIVLIAMVTLVNKGLELVPRLRGETVTLQVLLGYAMSPIAWLIGIPWEEARAAGSLMGTKTILNELIAYVQMATLPGDALSPRSKLILTYAMCGFANFGSLGIMIGGIGSLVPERRGEVVSLGLKSILAGTIATCMTGAVAGIIYGL